MDIRTINDRNTLARDALRIAGRPGKEERESIPRDASRGLPDRGGLHLSEAGCPLRQDFTISYARQGRSNVWSATARRGPLHRSVRHRGVVSAAYGPGDEPKDAGGSFSFMCSIRVDPSLDEPHDRRSSRSPDELLSGERMGGAHTTVSRPGPQTPTPPFARGGATRGRSRLSPLCEGGVGGVFCQCATQPLDTMSGATGLKTVSR